METSSPINHVFIDFENVPDIDLSIFVEKTVHLTLLVGPRQPRLDVTLVEKLLQHSAQVDLIRLTSGGRNALDFTLAYYVGRAAAADPLGYFHIIAKDTGYDPLIEHLRSRSVKIRRHEDFAKLTFAAPAKPKSTLPEDPVDRILEHLRRNATNRPKRQKTLITHLASLFTPKKNPDEVAHLIAKLQAAKRLAIDAKGAVTYSLG